MINRTDWTRTISVSVYDQSGLTAADIINFSDQLREASIPTGTEIRFEKNSRGNLAQLRAVHKEAWKEGDTDDADSSTEPA